MPFIAALAGMLMTLTSSLVGRVLLALGMGYVTYKGVGTSIDWLLQSIKTNMAGLDPQILQFLAFLWVDKAISMVFAAFAAASLIKMAGGSSLTKLVTKGGA